MKAGAIKALKMHRDSTSIHQGLPERHVQIMTAGQGCSTCYHRSVAQTPPRSENRTGADRKREVLEQKQLVFGSDAAKPFLSHQGE